MDVTARSVILFDRFLIVFYFVSVNHAVEKEFGNGDIMDSAAAYIGDHR